MKNVPCVLLVSIFIVNSILAEELTLNDPYGVQSHISVGRELSIADKQLKMMSNIGIQWVRTDLFRVTCQRSDGSWNFKVFDKMTKTAARHGIKILGTLGSTVPWQEHPANDLNAWKEYVRKSVLLYQDTIPAYEVWNEENIRGFWKRTPDPVEYVKLLRCTYQEIKKVNPSITVSFGGTSGIPISFIEKALQAGAANWFDVISVHPYQWGVGPEILVGEIKRLKKLLQKYNAGDKPIWITEVSWSTATTPTHTQKILAPILKDLKIIPSQTNLSIAHDSFQYGDERTAALLPKFKSIKFISLAEIPQLTIKDHPILIATTSQKFPAKHIPSVIDYVRRGGTILLNGGLPFYYEIPDNGKNFVQVNDKWMKNFHIGWHTWWTKKGTPKSSQWERPAKSYSEKIKLTDKDIPRTRFFLNDSNLHPGDEFIPVLEGGTKDYSSPICAVYRLNSDLKGNIILYPNNSMDVFVTEKSQAQFLTRSYLLSFACGVEKIFWFKFRSTGPQSSNREDHWGITTEDLTPKPAYHAYQTLINKLPTGSTRPVMKIENQTYLLYWKNPDKKKIWAVWNTNSSKGIQLQIKGGNYDIVNGTGKNIALQNNYIPQSLSGEVLYISGAETIDIYHPNSSRNK